MTIQSEYSIVGAKLIVQAGLGQCIRKQEMAVIYCLYLLMLILYLCNVRPISQSEELHSTISILPK